MYNNIPSQLWMLLDKPIRTHHAAVFEIPMTGVREIIDDRVISDGYSNKDLESVTIEKMTAYIGSEETFPRAWEMTCEKAKNEVYPVVAEEVFSMADEPKEAPITIMAETEAEAIEIAKEIINTKEKTNDSTEKKSK